MGDNYREPERMPLIEVPEGAVLVGPGGRLYMAGPRSLVADAMGIRAVLDYSGNLNVGKLESEVTTLVPDMGRDGNLDSLVPFGQAGWQYAVN